MGSAAIIKKLKCQNRNHLHSWGTVEDTMDEPFYNHDGQKY